MRRRVARTVNEGELTSRAAFCCTDTCDKKGHESEKRTRMKAFSTG